MENNTLFKTIEQLKETLTDISSARQQVTDTVTAYALTQKEIHSYAKHLKDIENALAELITLLQNNNTAIEQQTESAVSNLKTSCDMVLNKTNTELTKTTQKFADDTVTNINIMNKQIEKFDHVIENANKLTDKIEIISTEISKLSSLTATAQKNIVSSLSVQYNTIDGIGHTQNSISDQLETLFTRSNAITNDIKKLEALCTKIQNQFESYQKTLRTSIDKIKKEMEAEQKKVCTEIQSSHHLNIIILIIVVISIILQIVMK